jgi:iron complex transport system ATP-binding protein
LINHKDHKEAIRIEELTVGYHAKKVLEDISLGIFQGKFISLLGPNGSGKTTLLKTMSRLLEPLQGAVYLGGDDIKKLKQAEVARRQALVLSSRPRQSMMTAFELAALGRHPHTGFLGSLNPQDERKTMKALKMVDAAHLAHRYIDQLSDGERQKVMLAMALAQEPGVILLDEPTVHLDLRHRLEVMSILQKLCRQRGITVVASLHDVDLASRLSDEVLMVRQGQVMAWGPPEQVLTEQSVARLYSLNGAGFNRELGTIEVASYSGLGPVFVVAGGGTATSLLRLLAKRGYGLSCGVLHENDVDHYVAKALGASVVTEKAFELLANGKGKIREAQALMFEADLVIDSGFPVRWLNQRNFELINSALMVGKTVHSLRDPDEFWRLTDGHPHGVVFHANELELMQYLHVTPKEKALISEELESSNCIGEH